MKTLLKYEPYAADCTKITDVQYFKCLVMYEVNFSSMIARIGALRKLLHLLPDLVSDGMILPTTGQANICATKRSY
jgi:hypothetical protein